MKQKQPGDHDPARSSRYHASCERLFDHMPARLRETLDEEQRKGIVDTIVHLQRHNPRVLDELYMNRPYPGQPDPHRWSVLQRFRRRLLWKLRSIWFVLLAQKGERRWRNRAADYLFVGMVLGLFALLGLTAFFGLWWIKAEVIQIDFIEGYHFFVAD